jgi:predicted phosphodiesterase
MRYALISDLHANLQAWKAIHLDIRSNAVDYTICLGDVVGYGPNPVEVLQAVHKEVNAFVLGNHDAVACGKLDDSLFNEHAQESIRWTRAQLGVHAVRFLGEFPLSLTGSGFRCAHGEFSSPGTFGYVLTAEEALPSWAATTDPLLFVGHTHDPALFLLGPSGIPRTVAVQDFVVESGKRYFVNVGSAGHPRDGDPRASYCIYDSGLQSVFWRRVPFDLDDYRAALTKAGQSAVTSYFLHHDPRQGRPPLREMLNFSPPRTPDKAARDTVEVRDIASLRRRVRTWQLVSILLLLVAALAGGAGLFAAWRHHTRALVIEGGDAFPIPPAARVAGGNLLALPDHPIPPGQPCPGWRILLGNRHRQQVAVQAEDSGQPCLVMSSETLQDEICCSFAPVDVVPGMHIYPEARFLKAPGFEGHVGIVVSLTRQGTNGPETISHFYVKEPNQALPGGWMRARQKFDIPARGSRIQFHIRGIFKGRVKVAGLTLATTAPTGIKAAATAAPQTPNSP